MPREPRMKIVGGQYHWNGNIKTMKPSEKIDKIRGEYAKADKEDKFLILAQNIDAIIDFLDDQYEKEHALDGLKELEKQHNKNLKKPCRLCGTFYEDPKYCSVSGRTADKHVFEEELLGVDTGVPGGDKTAKVYGVKKEDGTIHISRVDYEEPVSERSDEKNNGTYQWCEKGHMYLEDVSERNALIDELIEGIGELKVGKDGYPVYARDVIEFLKSKKK